MLKLKKLIIPLSVLLLVACRSTSIESKADEVEIFSGGKAAYYSVVTDNETGCEYIEVYDHKPSNGRAVALTPRLNSDGKQICKNNHH